MDEKTIVAALQRMREKSPRRNFKQAVELIINLKGIDFSKPENRIELNIQMPHSTGKGEARVLVFARDKEFISNISGKVARIVAEAEIAKMDRKEAARLADEFDLLLAEGPVMLTVGKFLGQQLAPRGKMPKPIQPTLQSVENASRQAKGSLKVSNKKGKFMPVIQARVGSETMPNEELAANALAVYNALLAQLPAKMQNIKSCLLKLSMGPAINALEAAKEGAAK